MIFLRNAYDSHAHLLETALVANQTNLRTCQNKVDYQHLVRKPYLGSAFTVGFGWDDHAQNLKINRSFLDELYPGDAVVFSRVDGHQYALNSKALQICHLDQRSDGLFRDEQMQLITPHLPQPTPHQTEELYHQAIQIFNDAGITHLRDMTQTPEQFEILHQLEKKSELTLCCESYFHLQKKSKIDDLLRRLKALPKNSAKLKVSGVKFFIDGALGSEGACLQHAYPSGKKGSLLWERAELKEALQKVFKHKLGVAFHVLGDAASIWLIQILLELKLENSFGEIHFEHVEILDAKIFAALKKLKVTCHLQPSHFLDDQKWLKDQFAHRRRRVFAWRELEDFHIPFYFGSDSPIQSPELSRTEAALLSAERWGVPRLRLPWQQRHSQKHSAISAHTQILKNQNAKVFFNGQKIR